MDKIFALYDSDIFYATRFMEYFKGNREYDFRISVFTRKDSLEECLMTNPVEILLLGELITEDEIDLHNVRYIYRLTESTYMEPDDNTPFIYKYQSVKAVMKDIITNYRDRENVLGKKGGKEEGTKILSVFSPITGLKDLSFTWSLSLQLAEQYKVLFVLLELLPVQLLEAMDYTENALSEFIYYLKGASDLSEKLKLLQKQQGSLYYISGVVHGADILSLTKEDMHKWIENLRKSDTYQMVVFYISCYTEAMIELMKLSDSVLITYKENNYEAAVLHEWERQMSTLGINIRKEKFRLLPLTGEEQIEDLPRTAAELAKSPYWGEAYRYLNAWEEL